MLRPLSLSSTIVIVCLAFAAEAFAASKVALEPANIDPDNIASLQRGARNFMNYCSGCHGAQYVRYNTIGEALELSEEQLVDNLMFNAEKTFETIRAAMPAEDGERWFGVAPPDLSLTARAKTPDYIYTFLKSYYIEADSPTGVNNLVLAGTAMPHVLGGLQGFQRGLFTEHTDESGITTQHFEGFEMAVPGSLSAEEYDEFVRDTVNFLAYIAEPIRSDRRRLGVWVMMYLIVFLVIASMLKKQIWKDVK